MSETIDFVPPLTRPPAVAPALRRHASRNLKAGAALLLLAVGGYAVFTGGGYVTADSAVVSAYTVSLRAPITGHASSPRVRVGEKCRGRSVDRQPDRAPCG